MKRVILHILLGLTLVGCSKNEVTTSNLDNQALEFDVFIGATSKGGEVTTATLATYDFGVFGYYDSTTLGETATAGVFSDASTPNFMYNQRVEGWATDGTAAIDDYTTAADSWIYSPVKYWPNNTNDVLSFFAYAPHSSNISNSDCITFDLVDNMQGIPQLTYTLRENSQSVDFVVAAPDYNNKNTSDYSTDSGKIEFKFYHLLTRVKFSAYLDGASFSTDNTNIIDHDSTRVYLTKMIILGADRSSSSDIYYDKAGAKITLESQGFFSTNTFTYNAAASSGSTSVATDGDIEGVGSWAAEPTASTSDYSLDWLLDKTTDTFYFAGDDPSAPQYNTYTNPNGVDVWDKNESDADGNSVGVTELFKTTTDTGQEYLFLLPPNGTEGVDSELNIYVYIEYDVVTMDHNITAGYSKITNRDVIKLPESTLQRGCAYNYLFGIGLYDVTVEATVQAWDEINNEIAI